MSSGRVQVRSPKKVVFSLRRWLMGLVAVVVILGTAWLMRSHSPESWFPVRYVRVEGTFQHLDMDALQAALAPAVRGGYFTLDMGEIEAGVRNFAWVSAVRVARVWPDTLVVNVTEHQPVARWGDKALLNERGERFEPPNVEAFTTLPVLYGPPGHENFLLNVLKGLNQKLAGQNLSVAMLELSRRRAFSVRLTGDLVIHFGRQDPTMALERFLALVPRLGEESLPRLQRVDLRYPNGFSVVWKPKPLPDGENQPPGPQGEVLHPIGNATLGGVKEFT